MPYNNTAIPEASPEEATGQASLPLARVKRILHVDEDINNCSNNAAFVITLATEMFVQHLAKQAHNVAKSERKARRNIAYKDLATVVARVDNLEFLSDVIPRTIPYIQYKGKSAEGAKSGDTGARGQKAMTDDRQSDEATDPTSDGGRGEAAGADQPNNDTIRTHDLEVRVRNERSNGFAAVEESMAYETASEAS